MKNCRNSVTENSVRRWYRYTLPWYFLERITKKRKANVILSLYYFGQMAKVRQCSSEFDIFDSRENNPWMGGVWHSLEGCLGNSKFYRASAEVGTCD